MKIFVILMMLLAPVKHETHLTLSIPNHQQLFLNSYQNRNFSQKIEYHGQDYRVYIRSMDTLDVMVNFRMRPDIQYLDGQPGEIRALIDELLKDTQYIHDYLAKMSTFLGEQITYSTGDFPQDAASVVRNRRASCVGYANLCQVMLKAIGITSRIVEGFYLDRSTRKDILIPQAHLWVEIYIDTNMSIFYDPQYQNFTENYLVLSRDTDFTRIKRFKVKVIQKINKLIN